MFSVSVTRNSHFNNRLCLQNTVTSDSHIFSPLIYYALKLWYFTVRECFPQQQFCCCIICAIQKSFIQRWLPQLMFSDMFFLKHTGFFTSHNRHPTAYHAAVAWTDIRTPLHQFTLNLHRSMLHIKSRLVETHWIDIMRFLWNWPCFTRSLCKACNH
jgi:hypothetical protein